ncbi:MAG: hypothetical protein RIQ89_7 [Bacteroidota bacterium]
MGATNGPLLERLAKHNTNHKGFTGKTTDWQIKHSVCYETIQEAMERERTIKSWKSRKKIGQLVQNCYADKFYLTNLVESNFIY